MKSLRSLVAVLIFGTTSMAQTIRPATPPSPAPAEMPAITIEGEYTVKPVDPDKTVNLTIGPGSEFVLRVPKPVTLMLGKVALPGKTLASVEGFALVPGYAYVVETEGPIEIPEESILGLPGSKSKLVGYFLVEVPPTPPVILHSKDGLPVALKRGTTEGFLGETLEATKSTADKAAYAADDALSTANSALSKAQAAIEEFDAIDKRLDEVEQALTNHEERLKNLERVALAPPTTPTVPVASATVTVPTLTWTSSYVTWCGYRYNIGVLSDGRQIFYVPNDGYRLVVNGQRVR